MASPALTLAEEWLVAIRDGRLSVADAQRWAELRVAEGGADSTMRMLARCTSERTLHAWADQQPWTRVLPQPYAFQAPLATHEGVHMGSVQCLLPHELFSTLWAEAPLLFCQLFGDEHERQHYWAEQARAGREMAAGPRREEHCRWLRDHPATHAEPERRIPIGIHGDAGQMHGGEKILAISWGGLCRTGSTQDTRLPFMVIKLSQAAAEHATAFRAFETLTWSLAALCRGTRPARDERGAPFGPGHHPDRAARAGQPLAVGPAGPLCAAWAELRGDWEFLRDSLGLQHHYSAGSSQGMCHFCAATSSEGPHFYGDHLAEDAGPGLRQTLVGPFHHGHNPWAARHPVSPLAGLPGFSIWRCQYDLMHTLELGILQKLLPAALQGLMGIPPGARVARVVPAESAFGPGRSKAAQCLSATKAYREWAARTNVPHGSRVKRITQRWVNGAYPAISMEHAKAAAVRAMLPWVASVAEAHRASRPRSRVAQLRARCLTALQQLDALYHGQPRFLSRALEEQAGAHCAAALGALQQLTKLLPSGPYRLQPKAHALQHIVLDSAMQNPRHVHCYQDEDFIGLMKRTYTACHGATAPLRAIQRYRLGSGVQLTAREELLSGKRKARMQQPPTGGPLRGPAADASPAASSSAAVGMQSSEAGQARRGRGRPPKARTQRGRGRPRSGR